MKQLYFLLLLSTTAYTVQSQTYQLSLGGSHTTSAFNSVKFDRNDSGTINAGYIYDSTKINERDWYLVKLDKNKNIVWQKVIRNAGDDFIYKVIICKNGDYVAVGVLTQYGVPRGFVCRMNSSTGDVIWSVITNNTSAGEICYDVAETLSGNIAVAAGDQWNGTPNCFIILLNASGEKVWSETSTYGAADQPYSINQSPNGNLIVGINEWVGGHYNLILAELKEKNGKVVGENTYSINTTIPNTGQLVNSLAAWGINVIDNQISLYCYAFEGSGGSSSLCIYNLLAAKKLSGNIYYHTNDINTTAFTYTPLAKDDFLISESFNNPTKVYVSRITNGYVVYDDWIKGSATLIKSVDTTATGAVFSGSTLSKKHDNTYNLFAPQTDPVTNTSCQIVSANSLNLLPSNINATITSDISFVPGGTLLVGSAAFKESVYPSTVICSNGQALNTVVSNLYLQTLKEESFTASPNPATTTVHFTIPLSDKQSTLSIYNTNTEKVFAQQLAAGTTSKDINISTLTPGIYHVVLINDKVFSLKIIKY